MNTTMIKGTAIELIIIISILATYVVSLFIRAVITLFNKKYLCGKFVITKENYDNIYLKLSRLYDNQIIVRKTIWVKDINDTQFSHHFLCNNITSNHDELGGLIVLVGRSPIINNNNMDIIKLFIGTTIKMTLFGHLIMYGYNNSHELERIVIIKFSRKNYKVRL